MNIDWLNGFYIFVGLVTIVSLVFAVVVARRGNRTKALTCDVAPPLQLATILPNQIGHRLSIIYEREGAQPINVREAYLYLVRVANLGREPIRREDLVPSDLLRLKVQNTKVLDIVNASVSRPINNFTLAPFVVSDNGTAISHLAFDFLDYKDGALIRVLTDSNSAIIKMEGTIIGMPEGIYNIDDVGTERFPLFELYLLGVFVLMAGIIFAAFYFGIKYSVMWFWLILIIGSLVGAVVCSLLLKRLKAPSSRWPKELHLPSWYMSQYELDDLIIEDKTRQSDKDRN